MRRDGLLPPAGPTRAFAVTTLVNTIGNGMWMASSVLYFTRSVHLPAARVGLGLTVAGLVGLLAAVPIGHLADRRGPRGVYTTTLLAAAAVTACVPLVRTFWQFLLVATAAQLADSGALSAKGPIVHRLGGGQPARYRAYLRAVTNAGIALGALAAGYALQLDTRTAYVTLILADAVSFAAAAATMLRVPSLAPLPRPAEGHRWVALRDRPYLAVTGLNGLMSVQFSVLTVALPLWIAGHTHAPRWAVTGTLLINTLMIAAMQVAAGRAVDTTERAGAAMRRAGLVFLASAVLMALAADTGVWWWAALIVGAGAAVHTIGELWHQAGAFELGFGLAAEHAQGQYQGVYALGQGGAMALAPGLLTWLCLDRGGPGWLALGIGFALVGLAMPPVAGWAGARRPSASGGHVPSDAVPEHAG